VEAFIIVQQYMSNNVTYYLGAGASANALPLYSDFKKRLEVFRDYVYHYAKNKKLLGLGTKEDIYVTHLNELINQLDDSETTTLDALAHELYNKNGITSKLSFSNLKYLVSDFFIFEQLEKQAINYKTQRVSDINSNNYEIYNSELTQKVNTHIDKRYRSFINSELVNHAFPSSINIVSWNYDLQIELAFRRIRECSLSLAQSDLQVFPSPEKANGIDLRKSAIIKLNGTAGVYYQDNQKTNLQNFIYGETRLVDNYIDSMTEIFKNNYSRIFGGYPFFTFTFEKERKDLVNKAVSYAREIICQTSTLIVIGYSFHPLNREIDKKVFEQTVNLKNIIIQVPSVHDFQLIRNNLSRIVDSNISIEHNPYVNEFHSSNNI